MFTYFFIYLLVFYIHSSIWEGDAKYSRVFSVILFFNLIKSLSSLLWKWLECLYLLKSVISQCVKKVSFYCLMEASVDFVNLKQIRCEGYLLLSRFNIFWKPIWFFGAFFAIELCSPKCFRIIPFFFFPFFNNSRNYITFCLKNSLLLKLFVMHPLRRHSR